MLYCNPLNAELNPICHQLALLGAHHILHVSKIRVKMSCVYCCSCLVCVLSYYEYLLYYVCTAVFNLDAGLLARSQYSEGPATGHPDTRFSWFPCAYKQMLRWFPRLQVATTCFSCSPPD